MDISGRKSKTKELFVRNLLNENFQNSFLNKFENELSPEKCFFFMLFSKNRGSSWTRIQLVYYFLLMSFDKSLIEIKPTEDPVLKKIRPGYIINNKEYHFNQIFPEVYQYLSANQTKTRAIDTSEIEILNLPIFGIKSHHVIINKKYKVIYLRREDKIKTAISYYKLAFEIHVDDEVDAKHLEKYLKIFIKAQVEHDNIISKHLNANSLIIYYEDLMKQQNVELRKIISFLGFQPNDSLINSVIEKEPSKTLNNKDNILATINKDTLSELKEMIKNVKNEYSSERRCR